MPRPKSTLKPDFMSPDTTSEGMDPNFNQKYYKSTKALGVLFRDISISKATPVRCGALLAPYFCTADGLLCLVLYRQEREPQDGRGSRPQS